MFIFMKPTKHRIGCTAHGYDAKGNTLFLGMKNTFMKSQEPMLGEGRRK